MSLNLAKTGTDVTADASATVDTWIAGGLQFANGAAYSYVVLVGSGTTSQPWSRNLHAAQVGVPLADALLRDLEGHAKKNAAVAVVAPPATTVAQSAAANRLTPEAPMRDQLLRSH